MVVVLGTHLISVTGWLSDPRLLSLSVSLSMYVDVYIYICSVMNDVNIP